MVRFLESPYQVADWIINHRLEREKKVFSEALKKVTRGTPDTLVEKVYDDVDSSLFPIAKASLLAHLIKLEEDKVILRSGEEYIYRRLVNFHACTCKGTVTIRIFS